MIRATDVELLWSPIKINVFRIFCKSESSLLYSSLTSFSLMLFLLFLEANSRNFHLSCSSLSAGMILMLWWAITTLSSNWSFPTSWFSYPHRQGQPCWLDYVTGSISACFLFIGIVMSFLITTLCFPSHVFPKYLFFPFRNSANPPTHFSSVWLQCYHH